MDNKLPFDQHTTDIQKISQQRLSAIRKLKGLYVAPHLLLLLYQSIIQPILLYCSTCFFTMLSVTNRAKLTCITNTAAKIIGLPTPNLTELNKKSIKLNSTRHHSSTAPIHHPVTLRAQVQNHQVQQGSSGKKPDPCSPSGSKQQAPLICLSDILTCLSVVSLCHHVCCHRCCVCCYCCYVLFLFFCDIMCSL